MLWRNARQLTKRNALITAIIVFWLVMMGLLFRREFLSPAIPEASSDAPRMPADIWMGVYLPGDAPVGYINVNTLPGVRNGAPGSRTRLSAHMALTLFGKSTDITLLGSTWSAESGGFVEGDCTLHSGESEIRIEAAARDNDQGKKILDIQVHTAGETILFEIPAEQALPLWQTGGIPALDVQQLEPGKEYVLDAFDPLTMKPSKIRVSCTGEETVLFEGQAVLARVATLSGGALNAKVWFTPEGEMARMDTPLGFSLKRITAEQALALAPSEQDGALLQLSAITPSGKQPFRGATRMAIRVSGMEEDAALPEDDTQHATGGSEYVVSAPAGTQNMLLSDAPRDERTPYLQGDAFIQAEHPKIKEQALAITDGATDVNTAVDRLYEWVYASITKEAVASIPSALEVLQSRTGDCNEHAVLFTALARAAGVPTRIALGVVWSEEYGGFYYHAWPEIYDGQWVWVEPTLGQRIADATHIKLFTGGIETWPQLLPFLGRIQINVLDIE